VQKLFSNNKGTDVLSMLINNKPISGDGGLYASAALDRISNEIILKLVNNSDKIKPVNIVLAGTRRLQSKAKMIVMQSDDLKMVNSLDQPTLLSPVEHQITIKNNAVNHSVAPYSFTVIRIQQMP
jgi:alpha-L-arabinofuranosidase